MDKKCSIGLHTRVRDTRNLIANFSHLLDIENTPYTDDDRHKKCEIFEITDDKIDFISGEKMKGIGDHYYPLSADRKKLNRIGSDSQWNRIPVSGYNSKYKNNPEYSEKINKWETYCISREAKMFYQLTEEQSEIIKSGIQELEIANQVIFDKLKGTSISMIKK
mgnify:CR=1 FL=1|tara:strand:+ start:62 stop:553 length:492 start_codon:yes stop_codon:yes gene_type:complete